MADGDTQIPKMDDPLQIPCIKPGAMDGLQPFLAATAQRHHQAAQQQQGQQENGEDTCHGV